MPSRRSAYADGASEGAVHWHVLRVTKRRLSSPAGDQPRSRLPLVADARVGARTSCAARWSEGTSPLAAHRPVALFYSCPRAATSPQKKFLEPEFHFCMPGKVRGYPASITLASLIGSGSSPPESDLATAPATPPAGAVPRPACVVCVRRRPQPSGSLLSSTAAVALAPAGVARAAPSG